MKTTTKLIKWKTQKPSTGHPILTKAEWHNIPEYKKEHGEGKKS